MQVDLCIERARALIGTPFRLHGRDPATGLDCVGLVAHVWGRVAAAPDGYALRNSDSARWIAMIDQLAVRRGDDTMCVSDIMLMQAGPAQYHLGIFTGTGLIHAHAGLRRVVETPGPIAWPVLAAWQAPRDNS